MNILNKIKSLFTNSSETVNDSQHDQESTLEISSEIKNVLEDEILPGLDISAEEFWISFEKIIKGNPDTPEFRNYIDTLRATARNARTYKTGAIKCSRCRM